MADVPQQTAELLFFGLDHGIDSVRAGGPLTPFIIIERAGERSLARFVADTLEASVAQAVARIKTEEIAPGDRCALVYDGYLTIGDGKRFDAIYAEAIESDGTVTVMAQRYKPKGMFRRFETVGNPALLPAEQSKL